jgi:hypothetical protein
MSSPSTAVAVASEPTEWITGLAARRRLGIGYSGLNRLAVLREVRVRLELGRAPSYSRADVDRIAQRKAIEDVHPEQAGPLERR